MAKNLLDFVIDAPGNIASGLVGIAKKVAIGIAIVVGIFIMIAIIKYIYHHFIEKQPEAEAAEAPAAVR